MKPLRRGWRRLLGVLAKRRNERELAAELACHIEMQAEDNLRAGMSPEAAERAARLKFGGLEAMKESYRDQRGLPLVETLFADLRYALRGLRKNLGFTAMAMLTLALGIGATTAIFSVVNAVLLKPLPIHDVDRLVFLGVTAVDETRENRAETVASPAMFAHWRRQSSVLQDVAAFIYDEVMNYTGGEVVEQWRSMRVSADFFQCIGFAIMKGRSFTREEDLPNGPPVAVIGQSLWARRFANDPAILGRNISLNGKPYAVIGVVADDPAMLEFGLPTEVYVPFQLDPNTSDHGQFFMVMARLKPGVTLERANERLSASSGEFRAKFPNALWGKATFGLVLSREFMIGDIRSLLMVLLWAVGLVLLIACANVANLLLARGAGRRREIGIRAAIGAARGRIIRQLLTESVVLSVAAGILGLGLGYGGIRALLAVNTGGLARIGEHGATVLLDWRVLGFVLLTSLITAVLFGLFPALHSSRVDLNSVLKDSSGRTGTGLRQNKARAALVVSEVGLAVILLVASALLIRSFAALYKVDRGFETKNVLTMKTLLAGPKYAATAGVADTVRTGVERIRALPGVETATATINVPLQGTSSLPFQIIGRKPADGADRPITLWNRVSEGFFEVFNIPVRRGRTFNQRDGAKSPPVAIINETMAKQYWKDGNPLNDQIVIDRSVMKELKDEPVRQIIGIVADVRDTGLGNTPRPTMYVLQNQLPDTWTAGIGPEAMNWVVRTRPGSRALAPAIQDQLRQTIGVPVTDLLMMDEVVSLSTSRERFSVLLMSVFGCSALLLAAIGIYGLMAYTVEQQKQEIGIRLALGAEAMQVRNRVVRQGMSLALSGVVIGLGAAWGASRVLEGFLFGVKPQDPIAFAAVPAALSLVALLAVWLPANRASRVDPVVALRYE